MPQPLDWPDRALFGLYFSFSFYSGASELGLGRRAADYWAKFRILRIIRRYVGCNFGLFKISAVLK